MKGLRVHPAGWALLAALLALGQQRRALLAVAALLLHEGFHALAMRLFGQKIGRVELTPFGGVADAEALQTLLPAQRARVFLAGALGSVLLSLAVGWLNPPCEYGRAFRWMNLSLGLFNLLPALPLDGGRALLSLCGENARLRRALMFSGVGLGLAATALAIYGAYRGRLNLSLLASGPYLCYAAKRCYETQRARLIGQALHSMELLSKRGFLRVDAIACDAATPPDALARLLTDRPDGRLRCVLLVDAETGRLRELLTEREILMRLLGD